MWVRARDGQRTAAPITILKARIEERRRPTAAGVRAMEEIGVPAESERAPERAMSDEEVASRWALAVLRRLERGAHPMVPQTMTFAEANTLPYRPLPFLGDHTQETFRNSLGPEAKTLDRPAAESANT